MVGTTLPSKNEICKYWTVVELSTGFKLSIKQRSIRIVNLECKKLTNRQLRKPFISVFTDVVYLALALCNMGRGLTRFHVKKIVYLAAIIITDEGSNSSRNILSNKFNQRRQLKLKVLLLHLTAGTASEVRPEA